MVSERVAELFDREEVSGAALRPIRISRPVSANARYWYQVVVESADAVIVPPTRVGIDPFDDDPEGECRCAEGDLIGLNILSEVSISADTRGRADIVATRQFVGVRRGLLRPEPEILISPKVCRLIESEKLKGCRIEVAHLA